MLGFWFRGGEEARERDVLLLLRNEEGTPKPALSP